jgi:hypothetical protein
MTTSREAPTPDTAPNSRRQRWQFALSTLLAGMLVSAIFFGYSGLWWRRVLEERERSAVLIRRLEADLQAEKQAHRQTQARLLVAQSQLQDAVGVRMDQQIADRAAAERELKMVEQYAARLRSEFEAARKETEKLRVKTERNQPGGVP